MQRLIFYGAIVLVVVLLLVVLDLLIYRILRLMLAKQTAQQANAIIVTLLLIVVGVSAWWGNTHTRLQIMVTQTTVESTRIPEAFDGLRIVQISDLHVNSFGQEEGREFLGRLADTIAAQQPDIIVFTGDLVTIRAAEAFPFRSALAKIGHINHYSGDGYVPVYSILGNHDYADYAHDFTAQQRQRDVDSLIDLQVKAGWTMLNNSSVLLPAPASTGDSTAHILLAGVENIGEPPFSVYGDLDKALAETGGMGTTDSTFTILLSHNPTHWRRGVLPQTGIDLTLSGHTHATQVLIGSWSPAKWKYDEWMGLYTEQQASQPHPQYLYVNTGIGCVGPNIRIGIEPEVSVITLRRPQHQ